MGRITKGSVDERDALVASYLHKYQPYIVRAQAPTMETITGANYVKLV